MSDTENSNIENTNEHEHEEEEEESFAESGTIEGSEHNVPIDLSQNEVYRGICTLLEDEDGNNILEYISLLHTELIGINKSLENLKNIKKDISRIADCAELFFKSKHDSSLEHVKTDDVKKSEKTQKRVK
jgi:hypothetical protein